MEYKKTSHRGTLSLQTSLTIRDARLMVHLGHTDEERRVPQEISIDLQINFKSPPKACQSDELADTFCYDVLLTSMRDYVDGKEFRLIEKLGQELFDFVVTKTDGPDHIQLRINKINPPMERVFGGVQFSLSYSGE